ncbi:hypothetical protein QC761_0041370 [Podospora bellae-mahoneyi]|uniref:chitinase n=1 Tax=Podospora bellae-mahoneyi TaxID=2093777 RepID=A0ABR0FTL7_9PEZI|nr:hypothetical protein QC761_0041370 [Podospora bellae-mahoneyi]
MLAHISFSVVFAIYNPSVLWPIPWMFTWPLQSLTPTANGTDLGSVDESEIFGRGDPGNYQSIVSDPWLLIHGVKNLVNSTSSQFLLIVSLTISHICEPSGSQIPPGAKGWSRSVGNIIFFNLSRNGILPDVEHTGSCPLPVGAMSFYTVGKYPYPVQPELSTVKDCAYKIDPSTHSRVEESMLMSFSYLASLNPCPLNACCTVGGQCGTTAEFCTVKGAPFGTPIKPRRVGCISNCGIKVINNASPPSEFKRIGYFEAWSSANKKERPCLFMDATQIPTGYTHVHFAFGEVSSNFAVGVSKLKNQFDKFVKMRGFKRIIAFCVKPGNREILATNIAKFVVNHDLDGMDLDSGYSGAPDLPDIPSADPLDGVAYLELLKLLRQKLPWTTISKVVDYIVYMTYDLHGQWDFYSPWSSPGCPAGNCLRSHINRTETLNALSMVTKTGVSSTKLIIGITSYGSVTVNEEIKKDWANITCKHPYARNSSYRESDRWKTLKIDEAWKNVVGKWDACAKSGMPFPVFVSRLLNGPDGMYCGSISSTNNCLATVECSDESERRPAAALLLSSFVKLAGIYYELYDGIQAA